MHIGFITSEFSTLKYPDNIGGITSFVKNFSSQLITEGHKVSVFVYNQSNSDIFCSKYSLSSMGPAMLNSRFENSLLSSAML